MGLALELTEFERFADSLKLTTSVTTEWSVDSLGTVWTVLEWWLRTADASNSVGAAAADRVDLDLLDHAVAAWKLVASWASSGVALAFVVWTAGVGLEDSYLVAWASESLLGLNAWVLLWVTDTLVFVSIGTARAFGLGHLV